MITTTKFDSQKMLQLAQGMKANPVGKAVNNATVERSSSAKLISEATSHKLVGEKKEQFKAFLADMQARVEAHPNDIVLRKYYDSLRALIK